MKLITTIVTMLILSSAFAESAFEKKKKQEMLKRVDSLLTEVDSAREHLEKDEVKEACSDLQDMLKIYPDHLKAVGSHMNNYKTKVLVARDEVLQQLIFVHRQAVVCGQGENAEHVDGKDLGKKLKKIKKSLLKQRKLIDKEDTDYQNEFYYRYEF